jgi:GntR family transcriptional regulator, rspAB operon transcriptional repressor
MTGVKLRQLGQIPEAISGLSVPLIEVKSVDASTQEKIGTASHRGAFVANRTYLRSAPREIARTSPLKADFSRLEYVQLTELTATEIRRRILHRKLDTGSQIPVDTIAAQLGVSRTPVLEALKMLANEGLVEIRSRRGCFVKALTVQDVQEIFEAREAIELFCTYYAIKRGRHEALSAELIKLIDEMNRHIKGDTYVDFEAFIAADSAFHSAIVASGENQRLLAMYDRLNIHMHVLRVHYFRGVIPPPAVAKDHLAIQRSIAKGAIAAAEEATRRHLARTSSKMIINLKINGGSI